MKDKGNSPTDIIGSRITSLGRTMEPNQPADLKMPLLDLGLSGLKEPSTPVLRLVAPPWLHGDLRASHCMGAALLLKHYAGLRFTKQGAEAETSSGQTAGFMHKSCLKSS